VAAKKRARKSSISPTEGSGTTKVFLSFMLAPKRAKKATEKKAAKKKK
jgi:hypothetical protein